MTGFYIFLVVLILILAIIIHELGHFLMAKAVGIKATHFSIGFGPVIAGWMWGDTYVALKWIPAGGSVRILGMNPEEEISEEDLPRSYTEAPYWKRTLVILAGSGANIIMAFVIFYILMLGYGLPLQPNLNTTKIGPVSKHYIINNKKVQTPASIVGLKEGDVIKEIDGVKIQKWSDLTDQLTKRPGQKVRIVVQRGNKEVVVTPTLIAVKVNKGSQGKLGVSPYQPVEHFNVATGVWGGLKYIGLETAAIGKGLASLFSLTNLKVLIGTKARTISSPQSIYGGARLAVEAAKQGFDAFLAIMGSLILVIAIFNLLPLPPLDGGHLLVIVIEKVFKREVDMKKFAIVSYVVIILLIIIATRLFILDIVNPIKLP